MEIHMHYTMEGGAVEKIVVVNDVKELCKYINNMIEESKCAKIKHVWGHDGFCGCIEDSGALAYTDADKAADVIAERVGKFGWCFFGGKFGTYEGITIIDKDSDAYCKSIVKGLII